MLTTSMTMSKLTFYLWHKFVSFVSHTNNRACSTWHYELTYGHHQRKENFLSLHVIHLIVIFLSPIFFFLSPFQFHSFVYIFHILSPLAFSLPSSFSPHGHWNDVNCVLYLWHNKFHFPVGQNKSWCCANVQGHAVGWKLFFSAVWKEKFATKRKFLLWVNCEKFFLFINFFGS